MPPEVMPPGVVVESVDVVEEAKVMGTKATMEAPKAAEHLGLCLMVYNTS
jgi:hypothetical protein